MARSKQSNVLRETFYGVRYIVFFAVLISLVYGLLRLAGPLFMILIFDRVLPSRSEATLVSLLLLLVAILAVMTLLDYSRRRILARFGAQFQERIEDHIFSSAARDTYFGRSGSKPAAGLNEADQLRGFFHSGSLVSILDFLWSPVFLAVVFVISPMIGWVVGAGLALLVLIMTVKVCFAKARDEGASEASDKIGDLKDTLLVSRDVIESQQMMAAYNKRWVLARRRSRDMAVELNDWNAWFSVLSSHTARLIQYLALATGAYLTINGELTVGAMVASMYLARQVLYPMESFLKQVPSIREAIANWITLDRTLKTARAPTAKLEGGAALYLSQVTVRCPITKTRLLHNLNVEVSLGSAIEIVGSSNSGKTVLAEMLIGRFPRAGGNVLLGTIPIERLSITDAARTIGYVPQRVDFITATVEENIAGLDTEPDWDRLEHVARLAQMHDKILSLPDGYLTRIDAVGSIFSKSERHRLALARALYPDPKWLVVDEPDGTFREALSKSLKSEVADFLARGGILIMLTRLALKTYQPTRRFTLDDGELSEVKLDGAADRKVIRIQNGGKRDADFAMDSA
ncbi:ATP-binding cassette domain-containing protein [Mesorhizobium sp. AR10]|uniref:ATP-binding cassette domain-containing protein n=1 Tax=Mesorhizobium sp. AR10 TaxID=2865839 RepID=UPI002160575A|nr:ATP-binding cassette domain-containing protein [Mesorhizobium sp. AR10]UVK40984.1 ATP-binding cassette domain-containing protein [Mesorhizobium sp. AR10]